MKVVLHGGRFDGEVMDVPDEVPDSIAEITRLDLPYNPGSAEVPPFTSATEITYQRSNRILAGHHVFVLEGTKL